jgi:cytochrome c oxidase assembly factor 7
VVFVQTVQILNRQIIIRLSSAESNRLTSQVEMADMGIMKDVNELEQFFHNLGVEYRYSCYKEQNAEGCHLLGEYLDVIKQDYEKSGKVLRDNCDRFGYGKSCDRYGTYCFNGKGQEAPNYGQALKYFQIGCNSDHPISCYHAGRILAGTDKKVTKQVKPRIVDAVKMLEKGCTLGLGESCFSASNHYLFGQFGMSKNLSKAFELSEAGCHKNHYESCVNLQRMYKRGHGVKTDVAKANEIQEKVDDLDKQRKANKGIQMQQTD